MNPLQYEQFMKNYEKEKEVCRRSVAEAVFDGDDAPVCLFFTWANVTTI